MRTTMPSALHRIWEFLVWLWRYLLEPRTSDKKPPEPDSGASSNHVEDEDYIFVM